jgi:CRP-like cAMP-binding protein
VRTGLNGFFTEFLRLGQSRYSTVQKVYVTTVEADHQEVLVDVPSYGEFFGLASILEETPHQTNALTIEETACVEVSRDDIIVLIRRIGCAVSWTTTSTAGRSLRFRRCRTGLNLLHEKIGDVDDLLREQLQLNEIPTQLT